MTAAEIVVSALRIASAAAPGILAALTGAPTDAEALEVAREAVGNLPRRTGRGGAWDEGLEARIDGGGEQ